MQIRVIFVLLLLYKSVNIALILGVGYTARKVKIILGQVLLMLFHIGTPNQNIFIDFFQISRFAGG